ncbi:class I SAM-dependent methyltransferase [filamentous cyanobacterium LEGE 11480]|uniref:Class I SAM-dependent methyltransferase n=1 Tax=Romeriopsis navalis LEGE 11480 TaxID=2777977 RepID=A0A928VRQ8_9CYAN|nr:class I SAM-dependent methyltransferase [Romeriopsis navalis]MBE9030894.1 class I SAM-dependent methyltransferase [Romeriopsis navalis LEGE 11480]
MSSKTPLSDAEAKLLSELNAGLPQDVDWKQGALDYVANILAQENGAAQRRFHLIKPFHSVYPETPINQQLTEFTREFSHCLNLLSILSVSSQTRFLDVACGSGWLAHFLAKLNLTVVGIDISPQMIELAQERLALDQIATVELDAFPHVGLYVHDIEQQPIDPGAQCDVAVLESALHHFVNPIQTLRNIADSLSDDGVIVILEAASDQQGDAYQAEIMERYDTLERPYSREQLVKALNLANLAEYQFFYPLNGFFPPVQSVADGVHYRILNDHVWNTVIVAKQSGGLARNLKVEGLCPVVMNVTNAAKSSRSPVAVESTGEIGLKGELAILRATAQRIVRKSIAKLKR